MRQMVQKQQLLASVGKIGHLRGKGKVQLRDRVHLQSSSKPITEGKRCTVPEFVQGTQKAISQNCQGWVFQKLIGRALWLARAQGGCPAQQVAAVLWRQQLLAASSRGLQ